MEARIETPDGMRLAVRRGAWLVGRAADAHLRLDSDRVSGHHAWIRRDGRGTWVADAGSRNGTRVNGRRLAAYRDQLLRDGDRLEFGPVTAVYAEEEQVSFGVSFGDVTAGTINNAGRDVNHTYDNRREYTTPEGQIFTELATGRGAGRAVMVVGLLMLLAGFGIWMSVIVGFIKGIPTATATDFPPLLGPEAVDGVPLGVVGLVLLAVGGVVTLVGLVLSKARRGRY